MDLDEVKHGPDSSEQHCSTVVEPTAYTSSTKCI